MNYDIVIIGGGIIGSSVAYHLARDGRAGTIAVIERDITYSKAATPRGSGGIRQLFSLPENIEMARYGLDFYKQFDQTMSSKGDQISISFRRQGYLFVSDAGNEKVMVSSNLVGLNSQFQPPFTPQSGIPPVKPFPSGLKARSVSVFINGRGSISSLQRKK